MPPRKHLQFGRYDYAAFLTFSAYAAGSVIIPVSLVTLAQDLGFSLDQGGLSEGGGLHLGRTISMVFAMLLTGFVAGRWGTRRTLGYSVLLMSLGVFLCAVSPAYGILLVALMIAGLGEGVIEGLATPFVQNLHPNEPGRYVNITHAFWSVGIVVTVLLAGWALEMGTSWRTLTTIVAGISLLAAALILLPESKRAYPEPHDGMHWKATWRNARAITALPQFWIYYAAMFLAGGGEFCLTFWSASHIQLHFEASAWSGGLGVAIFATAMVAGRLISGYFVAEHSLGRLILSMGLFGALTTCLLPSAPNLPTFYGLLFVAGFATAPFWPSIQSLATYRLPQSDSTLLLILLSCAGVPGCGAFTYLMGALGNHSGSLRLSFYLVPAAYLLIAILIALASMSRYHIKAKHSA